MIHLRTTLLAAALTLASTSFAACQEGGSKATTETRTLCSAALHFRQMNEVLQKGFSPQGAMYSVNLTYGRFGGFCDTFNVTYHKGHRVALINYADHICEVWELNVVRMVSSTYVFWNFGLEVHVYGAFPVVEGPVIPVPQLRPEHPASPLTTDTQPSVVEPEVPLKHGTTVPPGRRFRI